MKAAIKQKRLVLPRADCDAPCFEQLKATHLRASPKQTGAVRCVASADKNMAAHNRSLSGLLSLKYMTKYIVILKFVVFLLMIRTFVK